PSPVTVHPPRPSIRAHVVLNFSPAFARQLDSTAALLLATWHLSFAFVFFATALILSAVQRAAGSWAAVAGIATRHMPSSTSCRESATSSSLPPRGRAEQASF